MKTLPVEISKKMLEVVPHVNSALTQFEAFVDEFDVRLYRIAGKHEYLHDFTLMLAVDDLKAISLILFDEDHEPLLEHVIDMKIEEEQAVSPLLNVFKAACAKDGPCAPAPPPANLPPLSGGGRFHAIYKGNGNIVEYVDFLILDWGGDSDDEDEVELREPVFTSRSHCDDDPPAVPTRALNEKAALQLSVETPRLTHYSD